MSQETMTSAPVTAAWKKLLKQPAFVAAVVLLGVAAVGLNGATNFMRLHFRKQAVPLRAQLTAIPLQLGPWLQVSKDKPLEHDIQDVLQTDKYVFRDFVDTRKVPASRLEAFKDATWRDRQALLARIQADYPKAVLNMAVTYYTGMVDTVAHIPDRCYIADGYQPTQYTEPTWTLGKMPDATGAGGEASGRALQVRFINFEDQGARTGSPTRSVTYFFNANGKYESNPLVVRATLQNLIVKYGYYAKVELMTQLPDREESASVKRDFLSFALPEIEKCLPVWSDVVAGKVTETAAEVGPTTAPAAEATTAPAGPAAPAAPATMPGQ